jgi:hypothetical protein
MIEGDIIIKWPFKIKMSDHQYHNPTTINNNAHKNIQKFVSMN